MTHPHEREAAEVAASRLSRWQIIDLVHIHRNGRMGVGRRPNGQPRSPVQRLSD
jgi:molybdopterin synthase catalytic subunit